MTLITYIFAKCFMRICVSVQVYTDKFRTNYTIECAPVAYLPTFGNQKSEHCHYCSNPSLPVPTENVLATPGQIFLVIQQ